MGTQEKNSQLVDCLIALLYGWRDNHSHRAMVIDDAGRESREDRREDHRPPPRHSVPDGRGGSAPGSVSPHPRPHRQVTTTQRGPMLTLEWLRIAPPQGGGRPECARRYGVGVALLVLLTGFRGTLSPNSTTRSSTGSE